MPETPRPPEEVQFTPGKRARVAIASYNDVFKSKRVLPDLRAGSYTLIMQRLRQEDYIQQELFFQRFFGQKGLAISRGEQVGEVIALCNTIGWSRGYEDIGLSDIQSTSDSYTQQSIPVKLVVTPEDILRIIRERDEDTEVTRLDAVHTIANNVGRGKALQEVREAARAAVEAPVSSFATSGEVLDNLKKDAVRFAQIAAGEVMLEDILTTAHGFKPGSGVAPIELLRRGFWPLGSLPEEKIFYVAPFSALPRQA